MTKSGIKYLLFIIYLLIISTSIPAQSLTPSKSVKKIYKTGKKYYDKGEYGLAIRYFLDVYSDEPDFLENVYFISIVYYNYLDDLDESKKFASFFLDKLEGNFLKSEISDKEYDKLQKMKIDLEFVLKIIEEKNRNDQPVNESEKESLILSTLENDIIDTSFNDRFESDSEGFIPEKNIKRDLINDNSKDANIQRDYGLSSIYHFPPINGSFFNDYSVNSIKKTLIEETRNIYENKNEKYEESISEFLSLNKQLQIEKTRYELSFQDSANKLQIIVLDALFDYNEALYINDSVCQCIENLKKKNNIRYQQIFHFEKVINDNSSYLSQQEKSVLPSSRQKIYVVRYRIDNTITVNRNEIVLGELLKLIENRELFIPKLETSILSVNEIDDEKYQFLIVLVSFHQESAKNNSIDNSGIDLAIFEAKDDYFINIASNKPIRQSELGLRQSEIKIINNLIAKNIDSSFFQRSFELYRDDYFQRFEKVVHKKQFLIEESNSTQVKIDSLTHQTKEFVKNKYNYFLQCKKNYDEFLKGRRLYQNFTSILMDQSSKQIMDQFNEMSIQICNSMFNDLNNISSKLFYLNTIIDSSRSNRISYRFDSIITKVDLEKFDVLSVGKFLDERDKSKYLGLNIGFVYTYKNIDKTHMKDPVLDNKIENNVILEKTSVTDNDEITLNVKLPHEKKHPIKTGTIEPNQSLHDYVIIEKEKNCFIKDPNNNYWKLLNQNPSSYISYIFEEQEEGWRLPNYKELDAMLNYLLQNKSDREKLAWPIKNGIYISSDHFFDNRGNRIHKGLKIEKGELQEIGLEDGAVVYLLVLSN